MTLFARIPAKRFGHHLAELAGSDAAADERLTLLEIGTGVAQVTPRINKINRGRRKASLNTIAP